MSRFLRLRISSMVILVFVFSLGFPVGHLLAAACKEHSGDADCSQNCVTMNSTELSSVLSELEICLTTAEKQSDEPKLEQLLSDDFFGVNQMGQRVDKQGFIDGLCRSGLQFEKLDIEDLDIRFTDDTAIVVGRSMFKVIVGEHTVEGTAQFIDTWKREGEQWKLFAVSVTPERMQ